MIFCSGCGDAVVQACNAIRPSVNGEGQLIIDKLNGGIKELRVLIANGDIQGQSAMFRNVGSAGLRNLATTTTDPCLQQVLLSLAEVDACVSYQLQFIQNPIEAAGIVCNVLNYKAQRINSCKPIAHCVVPSGNRFYFYEYTSSFFSFEKKYFHLCEKGFNSLFSIRKFCRRSSIECE